MVPKYLLILLMSACFLSTVSSRPSNNDDTIQYLPFYGGVKGQYLEIKKDTRGAILSEKIVPEDIIANENIFKSGEENLQSKIFGSNLSQLKSLSSSVLRLYNIGRILGFLGDRDKEKFKTQLASLQETASNIVKLIEEVGDDVDVLFMKKKPESTTSSTSSSASYSTTSSSSSSSTTSSTTAGSSTTTAAPSSSSTSASTARKFKEDFEDDVGDEGISIGAADESSENDDYLERGTISEAKPVGLAVVGENGLAASRPMATAVAASGVAIARPIATAIAGINPTLLGINFQPNVNQRTFKIVRKS